MSVESEYPKDLGFIDALTATNHEEEVAFRKRHEKTAAQMRVAIGNIETASEEMPDSSAE